MNLELFPLNYRQALQNGQASNICISGSNQGTLINGSNGLIFDIANNLGGKILIYAFALCYYAKNNYKAEITIRNNQKNRNLISPGTQIGNLAVATEIKTEKTNPTYIVPFTLDSGQTVGVELNNVSGYQINGKDLSLTLFGVIID